MDNVKYLRAAFEKALEELSPLYQGLLASIMTLIAHLDIIASVVALAVLLFQLKVSYYKSKSAKMAYDKECKGG